MIDWNEQWVMHVPAFKNEKSFRMKPDPGFGDLSHPITRLMLEMLPEKIEGAIAHAKENAELNGLNCFFGKTLPQLNETPLILMNMISSEQKVAWRSLPTFKGSLLITSGFPIQEEDPTHFENRELEGWKSFKIRL